MSNVKNVAIIMDGNGRWALDRGHPRIWGHIRGSFKVSPIVELARELELNSLTLYAFSTENWARPELEVQTLFKLFGKFIQREKKRIIKNGICFRLLGEREDIPKSLLDEIEALELATKNLSAMKLNLAFNYGGRREIILAVNKWIAQNPGKPLKDEKSLIAEMFCPDISEIDLVIRTGGDQRISNFLIWQAAYAELFFTPTPWPEFSPEELKKILENVGRRERRFGMVSKGDSIQDSVSLASRQRESFGIKFPFGGRS